MLKKIVPSKLGDAPHNKMQPGAGAYGTAQRTHKPRTAWTKGRVCEWGGGQSTGPPTHPFSVRDLGSKLTTYDVAFGTATVRKKLVLFSYGWLDSMLCSGDRHASKQTSKQTGKQIAPLHRAAHKGVAVGPLPNVATRLHAHIHTYTHTHKHTAWMHIRTHEQTTTSVDTHIMVSLV